MPASQKITYTFAANEELEINITGSYIRCVATSEDIEVQATKGSQQQSSTLSKGLGVVFDKFDKCRLINGSNAQTVSVYVGDLRVDDSSLHGTVDASFATNGNLADKADVTIADGTNALIAASNGDRKDLLICNLSGANTLRVGTSSAAANRGIPVGYGLSLTLSNFHGALYGYADGANIDVAVLEVTE